MTGKFQCGAAILVALAAFPCAGGLEMADAADPMIGTVTAAEDGAFGGHGLGKTFPGAATPFGQVQLSPDTVTGGDNGPGYSYHHKTIEGFSFLHMSGIGWYGDFGNFQVMPVTGPRILDREEAKSPYSHTTEVAKAGYYAVTLARYGVRAEMSASPTAGVLRFTYPSNAAARVQIDLGRRIGQKGRWLAHSDQTVSVTGYRTLEGRIRCSELDGGWGHGAGHVNYTVHYHAEFSEPFTSCGVWDRDRVFEGCRAYTGTNTGFFAEFGPLAKPLTLRVGLSFDSLELARANFVREVKGRTLEDVRASAREAWRQAFAGLAVEGGTERERTLFATALYHAFLDPREIGRVYAPDGTLKFVRRTIFSGWDVYRSEMPLLTLVRPDVVSDTINSMLETVTSGRRVTLPRWDIFGCASGCMIGQPIVSVMADAYEKGIRTFDAERALREACRTLERESPGHHAARAGLSDALEYAYADWCCARLAARLGHADIAAEYEGYAQAYTNYWSAEVGWMRSRTRDGGWWPWKGREVQGQGCVESNPWQQGWFVPHDTAGLIRLTGGQSAFTRELEAFFDATPKDFRWGNAYNHPNEPCHTLPFLFNLSKKPHLAQKWVRTILANAYGPGPYGLCGNEDVGQMSAWYVLSAIGLHPLCPGDGKWQIVAPIFRKTVIRLDPRYYPGREFTILAPDADAGHGYIAGIRLNGRPLDRLWVTAREVSCGGTLEIACAAQPTNFPN